MKSAPVNRTYRHVRSSGYLTPKYSYRKPPDTMSWLEDDFDLTDIDGNSRSKSPEPQLDDFIQKVLRDKRTSITQAKEKAYTSALYLATNIIEAAFDNEWLYPKYVRHVDETPEIIDFRAVDKNVYVGLVPLRKPIRINSFKAVYRSLGDMPAHRILVQVNDQLTKEEKLNVINDWGYCMDSNGYLRPEFVLCWFNKGLTKACENMEVENKRTQQYAYLETSLAKDGTIWTHIIGLDPQENYKINIVPCIPLSEVPRQVNLIAPIPSRRPHNDDQSRFLQGIHTAIRSGDEILFLEARLERWSREKRCSPSIEITWGVHIGQIEDRAFAFLNNLRPNKTFEDLIMLLNSLKEAHVFCLHAISNKVINHSIFFQYRKSLGRLHQKQDWLLGVLNIMEKHLQAEFFPNFFLQKQNIFMESDSKALQFARSEIKRMIKNLKSDPKCLMSYAGCDESPCESEDSEHESSHDSMDSDEEEADYHGENGDQSGDVNGQNQSENGDQNGDKNGEQQDEDNDTNNGEQNGEHQSGDNEDKTGKDNGENNENRNSEQTGEHGELNGENHGENGVHFQD